jgi:hypothetical protein
MADMHDQFVCFEGDLLIKMFAEQPGHPETAQELEWWAVDKEWLKKTAAKDMLGWGYTLFLPSEKCRPPLKHVRMSVTFLPAGTNTPMATASSFQPSFSGQERSQVQRASNVTPPIQSNYNSYANVVPVVNGPSNMPAGNAAQPQGSPGLAQAPLASPAQAQASAAYAQYPGMNVAMQQGSPGYAQPQSMNPGPQQGASGYAQLPALNPGLQQAPANAPQPLHMQIDNAMPQQTPSGMTQMQGSAVGGVGAFVPPQQQGMFSQVSPQAIDAFLAQVKLKEQAQALAQNQQSPAPLPGAPPMQATMGQSQATMQGLSSMQPVGQRPMPGLPSMQPSMGQQPMQGLSSMQTAPAQVPQQTSTGFNQQQMSPQYLQSVPPSYAPVSPPARYPQQAAPAGAQSFQAPTAPQPVQTLPVQTLPVQYRGGLQSPPGGLQPVGMPQQ